MLRRAKNMAKFKYIDVFRNRSCSVDTLYSSVDTLKTYNVL